MNFFEHQEAARRNTRVMVLLYALAVVAVVLAVDVVLGIAWLWASSDMQVPRALYVWGALGTAAAILLVSLYRIMRLRAGGKAVAEMVGATPVPPDTRDPLERRLINVVEEMAIAAGTRVPAVYVMQQESGINAFAAGYDVSNSVIAVTRGTLECLNRDELQGVIGHEYSHIVNGDMRLNIRMVGVLSGIVFIGAIGEFLMRSAGRSRGRRDSGAGQIFAIGLALLLIGYLGLFFARLIKASVSRQREFLADASSVQFTRNPGGIAGALDQIRTSAAGTLVANRYAEDMSHMFFGQAVRLRFAALFATHPPLDERIRRVDPQFAAAQYRKKRASIEEPRAPAASGQRAGDQAQAWGRSAAESMALVGTLDAGKVDYARRLLGEFPAALREALRTGPGAAAATVALLLATPKELMEQQLAAVQAAAGDALSQAARALAPEASALGPQFRLPVVDLALPALKAMQDPAPFLKAIEAVIEADRRVSLHEFVVLTLLRSQLQPAARAPKGDRSVSQLGDEIRLLLSLLAHAGTPGEAARAFGAGVAQLGMPQAEPVAREALSLQSAGEALERLRALAPLAKAELVRALFASATADRKVRISEAELMRLVGAVLGCPVPPLFEDL
ncbi:MAG TPA: M48 family metallopeptidase [Burkholderiales bacterium]|nr:M48 family metallopeptidase [Burkholderiales bacterium]